MEDTHCRQFFLEPAETYHRQYEALRAFFVEGRRLKQIAQQFGYQESSLRTLVCRFRNQVKTNAVHPFLCSRRSSGRLVSPVCKRRSVRTLRGNRCLKMYVFDFMSFSKRYLIPNAVPLPVTKQFRAALAGFLALTCTFFLAGWLVPGGPATLLCGPLAASTVLLFVLPHSPVAQPWPLLGGSFLASLIGLAARAWIDSSLQAVLVAVPVAIILMNTLRCLHPPGAAAAAMFATTYSSWIPFGLGATLELFLLHLVLLLSAALCLNNWLLQHS